MAQLDKDDLAQMNEDYLLRPEIIIASTRNNGIFRPTLFENKTRSDPH